MTVSVGCRKSSSFPKTLYACSGNQHNEGGLVKHRNTSRMKNNHISKKPNSERTNSSRKRRTYAEIQRGTGSNGRGVYRAVSDLRLNLNGEYSPRDRKCTLNEKELKQKKKRDRHRSVDAEAWLKNNAKNEKAPIFDRKLKLVSFTHKRNSTSSYRQPKHAIEETFIDALLAHVSPSPEPNFLSDKDKKYPNRIGRYQYKTPRSTGNSPRYSGNYIRNTGFSPRSTSNHTRSTGYSPRPSSNSPTLTRFPLYKRECSSFRNKTVFERFVSHCFNRKKVFHSESTSVDLEPMCANLRNKYNKKVDASTSLNFKTDLPRKYNNYIDASTSIHSQIGSPVDKNCADAATSTSVISKANATHSSSSTHTYTLSPACAIKEIGTFITTLISNTVPGAKTEKYFKSDAVCINEYDSRQEINVPPKSIEHNVRNKTCFENRKKIVNTNSKNSNAEDLTIKLLDGNTKFHAHVNASSGLDAQTSKDTQNNNTIFQKMFTKKVSSTSCNPEKNLTAMNKTSNLPNSCTKQYVDASSSYHPGEYRSKTSGMNGYITSSESTSVDPAKSSTKTLSLLCAATEVSISDSCSDTSTKASSAPHIMRNDPPTVLEFLKSPIPYIISHYINRKSNVGETNNTKAGLITSKSTAVDIDSRVSPKGNIKQNQHSCDEHKTSFASQSKTDLSHTSASEASFVDIGPKAKLSNAQKKKGSGDSTSVHCNVDIANPSPPKMNRATFQETSKEDTKDKSNFLNSLISYAISSAETVNSYASHAVPANKMIKQSSTEKRVSFQRSNGLEFDGDETSGDESITAAASYPFAVIQENFVSRDIRNKPQNKAPNAILSESTMATHKAMPPQNTIQNNSTNFQRNNSTKTKPTNVFNGASRNVSQITLRNRLNCFLKTKVDTSTSMSETFIAANRRKAHEQSNANEQQSSTVDCSVKSVSKIMSRNTLRSKLEFLFKTKAEASTSMSETFVDSNWKNDHTPCMRSCSNTHTPQQLCCKNDSSIWADFKSSVSEFCNNTFENNYISLLNKYDTSTCNALETNRVSSLSSSVDIIGDQCLSKTKTQPSSLASETKCCSKAKGANLNRGYKNGSNKDSRFRNVLNSILSHTRIDSAYRELEKQTTKSDESVCKCEQTNDSDPPKDVEHRHIENCKGVNSDPSLEIIIKELTRARVGVLDLKKKIDTQSLFTGSDCNHALQTIESHINSTFSEITCDDKQLSNVSPLNGNYKSSVSSKCSHLARVISSYIQCANDHVVRSQHDLNDSKKRNVDDTFSHKNTICDNKSASSIDCSKCEHVQQNLTKLASLSDSMQTPQVSYYDCVLKTVQSLTKKRNNVDHFENENQVHINYSRSIKTDTEKGDNENNTNIKNNKLSISPTSIRKCQPINEIGSKLNVNYVDITESNECTDPSKYYIENNKLSILPKDISKCQKLNEIDSKLTVNAVDITEGKKCTNPSKDYIDYNKLSILPKDISKCQTLNEISSKLKVNVVDITDGKECTNPSKDYQKDNSKELASKEHLIQERCVTVESTSKTVVKEQATFINALMSHATDGKACTNPSKDYQKDDSKEMASKEHLIQGRCVTVESTSKTVVKEQGTFINALMSHAMMSAETTRTEHEQLNSIVSEDTIVKSKEIDLTTVVTEKENDVALNVTNIENIIYIEPKDAENKTFDSSVREEDRYKKYFNMFKTQLDILVETVRGNECEPSGSCVHSNTQQNMTSCVDTGTAQDEETIEVVRNNGDFNSQSNPLEKNTKERDRLKTLLGVFADGITEDDIEKSGDGTYINTQSVCESQSVSDQINQGPQPDCTNKESIENDLIRLLEAKGNFGKIENNIEIVKSESFKCENEQLNDSVCRKIDVHQNKQNAVETGTKKVNSQKNVTAMKSWRDRITKVAPLKTDTVNRQINTNIKPALLKQNKTATPRGSTSPLKTNQSNAPTKALPSNSPTKAMQAPKRDSFRKSKNINPGDLQTGLTIPDFKLKQHRNIVGENANKGTEENKKKTAVRGKLGKFWKIKPKNVKIKDN